MRTPARTLLATGIVTTALLAPVAALACGGMFCSLPPDPLTPSPPAPVDQTGERIIFEVDADTITAHVQIAYTGSADSFAWIVPVPVVPVVEESRDAWFDGLEAVTRPSIILPAPDPCPVPNGGGRTRGGGCGADDSAAAEQVIDGSYDPEQLVTVLASSNTDNYEYVVVEAAQASDLTGWLTDNGYNVSDNMAPAMQPYLDGGMVYLALKLRDGRTAENIVPIAMTYDGQQPMIPLELTAVAAQPLMGVQVWILGDDAYQPENWAEVTADTEQLAYDENGRVNYFAWVARAAAEADGHLFVNQGVAELSSLFAQDMDELFDGHSVVSRYYTRINPEHMNLDPMFAVAPAGYRVPFTIDMTANASIQRCFNIDPERLPSECAFHFCGEGATCYETTEGLAACDCPNGQVASPVTSPDGTPSMTCVPAVNPLGITAEAGGAGGQFDPCADVNCGAGTCVLRSGFPTCLCDDGAVACLEDAAVTCVPGGDDLAAFGPGGGIEAVRAKEASASVEPAFGIVDWRMAAAPGAQALLVGLGLLALRRRRLSATA